MSTELMALTDFMYEEANVRVLGTKFEPWFVAVDVFRAIGAHTKNITRSLSRLDDDEKSVVNLTTGPSVVNLMGDAEVIQGSHNTVWLVSEPGLYKILLRARTPKAEAFSRFVTHEVLPSIRRFGYYKVPGAKGIRNIRKVSLPFEKRCAGIKEKDLKFTLANGERVSMSLVHCSCCDLGADGKWVFSASVEELLAFINSEMARRGYKSISEVYYNTVKPWIYDGVEHPNHPLHNVLLAPSVETKSLPSSSR